MEVTKWLKPSVVANAFGPRFYELKPVDDGWVVGEGWHGKVRRDTGDCTRYQQRARADPGDEPR